MAEEKNESLDKECDHIFEDSRFTAEVHHIIAKNQKRKAFNLKFYPILISIASALALLFGSPEWVAWIMLLSAMLSMLNMLIEPEKDAALHLFAAKNFIVLKHEANSIKNSFSSFMEPREYFYNVKNLREKYNLIVRFVPPADDTKAVEQAVKNIKEGIHSYNGI